MSLERDLAETRTAVQVDLSVLKSSAESLINTDIQLLRGVTSFVRLHPDLTQSRFADFTSDLLSPYKPHIRHVDLAANHVISHIYPVAGNEAAIGLDLMARKEQRESVLQLVEHGSFLVAGPVDLVQGGTAIIIQTPVHTRETDSGESGFWGIASLVISFDRFLDATGLAGSAASERLDLALVGRDGRAAEGEIFWGSPTVLQRDPALTTIQFDAGRWILAGVPRTGWPVISSNLGLIVFIAGAGALFLCFLIHRGERFDTEMARSNRMLRIAKKEADDARNAAERANQAKSAFLAAMSHELRTPLNIILGFSELLEMTRNPSPETERMLSYARDIRITARQLLGLINDVLDISAIEAGSVSLQPRSLCVMEMVADILQLVETEASERGIAVQADLPARLRNVHADHVILRQVLTSLLSNSLRFVPVNGRVLISARSDEHETIIVLTDPSGTIPEVEMDPRDPFQLSEGEAYTARNPHYRSWSLCMVVIRSLIDLHGGTVLVARDDVSGTSITVSLPHESAAAAAA